MTVKAMTTTPKATNTATIVVVSLVCSASRTEIYKHEIITGQYNLYSSVMTLQCFYHDILLFAAVPLIDMKPKYLL